MEMVDAETPKTNAKQTDLKSEKKAVIIFSSFIRPSYMCYLHMD